MLLLLRLRLSASLQDSSSFKNTFPTTPSQRTPKFKLPNLTAIHPRLRPGSSKHILRPTFLLVFLRLRTWVAVPVQTWVSLKHECYGFIAVSVISSKRLLDVLWLSLLRIKIKYILGGLKMSSWLHLLVLSFRWARKISVYISVDSDSEWLLFIFSQLLFYYYKWNTHGFFYFFATERYGYSYY